VAAGSSKLAALGTGLCEHLDVMHGRCPCPSRYVAHVRGGFWLRLCPLHAADMDDVILHIRLLETR